MELDRRGNSHEGVNCLFSTPLANFSAPRYQKWKPNTLITFHLCFLYQVRKTTPRPIKILVSRSV